MNELTVQWVHALLYLCGCAIGLLIRAGQWLAKQTPENATMANWWRARYGPNLISVLIGVLGTGIWSEGSLIRWLHFGDQWFTWGLAPIAGAAFTWGARYIVARASKTAAEKAGGEPAED